MSNYDEVEESILMEGMTPAQKLQFHREISECRKDPKRASRLCFWFGGIGAHHFYIGNSRRGWIQIALLFTGVGLITPLFDLFTIKEKVKRMNSEAAHRIAMRITGQSVSSVAASGTTAPSTGEGMAHQTVPAGSPNVGGGSKGAKKVGMYVGAVFGIGLVISLIGAVVGNKDQGGSTASAATTSPQGTAGVSSPATSGQPAPVQERALADYAGRIPDREFFERPDIAAALVKTNANDSNLQSLFNREFEPFVRQDSFLVAETVPNRELLEIIAVDTNTKALTVAVYRVLNEQPTVSIGSSDRVRDIAALPSPIQDWVAKRSFGDQKPKIVFLGEAETTTPASASQAEQK